METMETQEKLLDNNYLATRLNEFKEIKRGDVTFEIYGSDRLLSKTIYITFFIKGSDKWYKQFTIRISDHLAKTPHKQFLIEPNEVLTKRMKRKFMKLVEKTIKSSKIRNFYKEIEKVSSEVQNDE